jgi:DNA (cytosine-5)-methyltransferase 1
MIQVKKLVRTPALVDLFAGCGGLSLGLETAGFETVFVNELHPTARSTYLMNRLESNWLQRSENQSGDILAITQKPDELSSLAARLRSEFGDIGLVSGGPPCQGFSGIGHRRSFDLSRNEIPGNHLYREMASMIRSIAPRAFLFENVKGLLSARWTPGGSKGEIWNDVSSTFNAIECTIGKRRVKYHVWTGLVYAKDFGVPQNRPRVIILGIRKDVCSSKEFAQETSPLQNRNQVSQAPHLIDLLDDLVDPRWQHGPTLKYPANPKNEVQESFRRSRDGKSVARRGDSLSEQVYSKHDAQIVKKFEHMIANDGEIPSGMRTKKFAQRVLPRQWTSAGPSITATSLPDDYVHYSLPRTPTVREWARLQTFPDWYEFAGRRTTGGRRRAGDPAAGIWDRDLPKYTQIGNAVPVEMGKGLGQIILKMIS